MMKIFNQRVQAFHQWAPRATVLRIWPILLCLLFVLEGRAQVRSGTALDFPGAGANSVVQMSAANALSPFPMTITAWVRTPSTEPLPNPMSIANKLVGFGGYTLSIN